MCRTEANEEMCKEVNAYPKCAQQFKDELADICDEMYKEMLEHGLQGWHKQASAHCSADLKRRVQSKNKLTNANAGICEEMCRTEANEAMCKEVNANPVLECGQDLTHHVQFMTKIGCICEEICKKADICECPPQVHPVPRPHVEPDSTTGVLTWDALLEKWASLFPLV